MSAADQWRWTDDEGVQRLLRGDELRAALADGRLKPTTLVWKRGMQSWVAAAEVPELMDAIDSPDTVTKQRPKTLTLGQKAMPTPSIPPAPGVGAPRNMVDVAALRGADGRVAGARAPATTLTGVGRDVLPQGEVQIPVAPRVPKLDGGWRDGAARRDAEEDTVTLLRTDDDPTTLAEHLQPQKKKTVPPPRKGPATTRVPTRESKRPPPPVRARATQRQPFNAQTPGATPRLGATKTLTPRGLEGVPPRSTASPAARTWVSPRDKPLPSVPPPVGSSEVLSERFNASHAEKLAAKADETPGATTITLDGDEQLGAEAKRGTANLAARKAVTPAPGAAADAASGAAHLAKAAPSSIARPERRSRPTPEAAEARELATGPLATGPLAEAEELQWKPLSNPPQERRSAPAMPPPPPAAPPPAIGAESLSVSESLRGHPALVSSPPPIIDVSGQRGIPTELPPRPPGAGITLRFPIIAGAGAAALLLIVLSFVFGRLSAPAQQGLAPVLRAQVGWAVVPLFTRTRSTPPEEPRPCLMLRAPARFADAATKTIPLTLAVAPNERMAVGFAQNETEAGGLLVDPATGGAELAFKQAEQQPLARSVPLVNGGDVKFAVTHAPEGKMVDSTYVSGAEPFVIGFDTENVLKAPSPGADAVRLWSLPDATKADALRTAVDDKGVAVTYRHGNKVHYGLLKPDGEVVHAATPITASNGMVGLPNVALGGGRVSVVFADKANVDGARWELRWARGPVGEPLKDAALVELPAGGPGGDAGAPAVAALPGGRWVLMWMEGSKGERTIRAQTYDEQYRPLGEALRVSPETGSFGQGMIGVVGDKAVVVFLLELTSGYEVWGTVLQCR